MLLINHIELLKHSLKILNTLFKQICGVQDEFYLNCLQKKTYLNAKAIYYYFYKLFQFVDFQMKMYIKTQ